MTRWPDGDPTRACLVLDFDGTLAPIVADPEDSEMPGDTRASVARLQAVLGRVAVVSGRSAHFLKRRVGVAGVELVGLYGLEEVVDGVVQPDSRVRPWVDALDEARAVLPAVVEEWEGAHLEDKGLALAVHWRRAVQQDEAGIALSTAVRGLDVVGRDGLAVEDGKMVIEVRPPVQADKGTAVDRLTDGFAEVAYAGDDLGDLPAFAAVARRRGLTIAVDHGPETDPRVREAAGMVVDGTEGFAAWLADLADRLED